MRKFSSHLFTAMLAFWLLPINTQATQRCVVDDSGREVCVSDKPSIISLAPGTTELLFAAGAGKQVIAVDEYSDFPPEVIKLPTVGGYPNINVEAIVARKPQLVVIWSAGNSQQMTRHLEQLGVNTFHINAETIAGIDRVIRQLGKIAGTEQAANKAADDFSEQLAGLKKQYQHNEKLSVFFEIWREPLMSVGGSQVITDAIAVCGGRSLYADVARPTVKVGMEQLIAENPDVILSSDPRGDTPETREAMLDYWQRWTSMTAVKKKQLFSVPSDYIARLAPRILKGTAIICQQLQSVREQSGKPDALFAEP